MYIFTTLIQNLNQTGTKTTVHLLIYILEYLHKHSNQSSANYSNTGEVYIYIVLKPKQPQNI